MKKKSADERLVDDIHYRKVEETFFQHEEIKKALPHIQKAVQTGALPVTSAVDKLMSLYLKRYEK